MIDHVMVLSIFRNFERKMPMRTMMMPMMPMRTMMQMMQMRMTKRTSMISHRSDNGIGAGHAGIVLPEILI